MSQYGIKLPPGKLNLLQCRLQKRLRMLRYNSFKDYVDYVFSPEGLNEEVPNMIDAVCTNKTDFFRESVHFEFLSEHGIRDYLSVSRKNKLSVLSAGCSSGEEPYSIAMVLQEYCQANPGFEFSIVATDISCSVLEHAIIGIYSEDKIKPVPVHMRKKYFLRGKNEYASKVRICSELRSKVDFRKFNLLSANYSSLGHFDMIFCRNVLIYFDREIQMQILNQLCGILNRDGYLFLGHSESITGFDLPLSPIRPTLFRKTFLRAETTSGISR